MKKIQDLFTNSKYINVELLKYAMEVSDKKEKKEKKLKQDQESKKSKFTDGSFLFNLTLFGLFMTVWVFYRSSIYGYFNSNTNNFY